MNRREPLEDGKGRAPGSGGQSLLPSSGKRPALNLPAYDPGAKAPGTEEVPGGLLELNSYFGGRYRVLRLIALGGMSEVYEAWDMEREGACALKILRLQHRRSDKLRLQMAAEARALIELDHPNIVAVWDAGVTGEGLIYFAMELLDGTTLLDGIYGSAEALRTGFVPLRVALDWMAQLTGAVHALHLAGIIHRDLKPENVFVTRDGRVKVLDLGAAKFRCYGLRTTGAHKTIGTPPYMSPEHLRGDPTIDGRSDVYSLGHVFYEVLAKRHAFSGPGESYSGETYRLWQEQRRPEPLTARRPGLPPILDEVVRKALEKRREDRWQSCEDLHLATLGVADHLESQGLLDEAPEVPARVREAQRIAAATTDEAVPGRAAALPFVHVQRAPEPPARVAPASIPPSQVPISTPRRTDRGTEIMDTAGAARSPSSAPPSLPPQAIEAAPTGRYGTIPIEPRPVPVPAASPAGSLEVVTSEPRRASLPPAAMPVSAASHRRARPARRTAMVVLALIGFAGVGAVSLRLLARRTPEVTATVTASPPVATSAPVVRSAPVVTASAAATPAPAATASVALSSSASAEAPRSPSGTGARAPATKPAVAPVRTPATPPAATTTTARPTGPRGAPSAAPKSDRVEDGSPSILPFGKGR